jgi:predicted N-acetyltransferase YhbS
MAEIRDYQVSDYPKVREILEMTGLYWEPSDNKKALERKISQSPGSILIAVESGRVVGVECLVEDFLPFIFRLSVHPNHRNKGIGGN